MITFDIPGGEVLRLKHLVLDYNGTIAEDGSLFDVVKHKIALLHPDLSIHIVTADTFGSVQKEMENLPVEVVIIPRENQGLVKQEFVEGLGPEQVVSIGNGANDAEMLEASALGILVVNSEGASVRSLLKADVLCNNIRDAMNLLIMPGRLIATLRR